MQFAWLILLCYTCWLPFATSSGISLNTTCGNKLQVDEAELSFKSLNGLESFAFYAMNHNCYLCSNSLLADSSIACSQVFTPHAWTLMLFNGTLEISSEDFLFVEHGVYDISISSDFKIEIGIISEPEEDSNLPLFILLTALFFFIVITRFCLVPMLQKKHTTNCLQVPVKEKVTEELSLPFLPDDSSLSDSDIRHSMLPHNMFQQPPPPPAPVVDSVTKLSSSPRLGSLDTFRGLSLFLMIFVNYGGGG
jgi:hypothetical protein